MEYVVNPILPSFAEENRACMDAFRMINEAFCEYQELSLIDDYMMEAFGKKKETKPSGGNKEQSKGETEENKNAVRNSQAQQEVNAGAAKKAQSGLMTVIDKIISMIKKLKSAIVDFIDRRKLDTAQREAFDAFREACKKDPSLKNKKFTVTDWKKIESAYNQHMAECQKAYEDLARNVETPIDHLIKKGKNLFKDITGSAVTTVTAMGIANMASTNKETASVLREMLNSNEEAMVKVRQMMGESQVKHLDKELKMWTKRASLKRHMIEKSGEYYDNYVDAMMSPLRTLKQVASGKIDLTDRNQRLLGRYAATSKAGQLTGAVAKDVAIHGVAAGAKEKASYIGRKAFARKKNVKNINLGAPDDPTGKRYKGPRTTKKDTGIFGTLFTKPGGGSVKQIRKREKANSNGTP